MKKKNPIAGSIAFVASAAVVGTGIAFVGAYAWRALRGPKAITGHEGYAPYVGTGWPWPKADRFPNTRSFGHALNALGYATDVALPDWKILSPTTMNTVESFQRDYNVVRSAYLTTWPVGTPPQTGFEIGPLVYVNGRVGPSTIQALIFAQDYERDNPDDSWSVLVADARLIA